MTDAEFRARILENARRNGRNRQTAFDALIDSEMARTDWLSLPRMLRWRFLLSKHKADLLAREFMRMLCLHQLSHGAIIVPGLLMSLVGWFERNPAYKVHVAAFAKPMPHLSPVKVAESGTPWRHTLSLYEEVFGSPPSPAIWTLGSPAFFPWAAGWIVGAIMGAVNLIPVFIFMGISMGFLVVSAHLLDRQLTIALVRLFNFETSENWAAARRAFFFSSSFFLWSVAFVKLGFFLQKKVPSLPLGHPLRHAIFEHEAE